MQIRRFKDCREIIAGDKTRLRELLHPDREYKFSGRYSLAQASLSAGERSQPHKLSSSEVYYILQGTGRMHIDEEATEVSVGDVFEIPPNSIQWIENSGESDLEFICIVDPAWEAGDEEVL